MKSLSKSVPTKISLEVDQILSQRETLFKSFCDWLLSFANLGRKPGKINPGTPCGWIMIQTLRKEIDFTKPDFSKLPWQPRRGNGIKSVIDRNKNIWVKFPGNNPVWSSQFIPFPKKEFLKLVSAKGWPYQGELRPLDSVTGELENIQDGKLDALWRIVRESLVNSAKRQSGALEDLFGEERYKFPTTIAFYYSVVNFVWHFYNDQEDLYKLLRICPLCGGLWIKEGKRKPKIFCSDQCKRRFHALSKEEDSERKKIRRAKEAMEKKFGEVINKRLKKEDAEKQARIQYLKKIEEIMNKKRPVDIQ